MKRRITLLLVILAGMFGMTSTSALAQDELFEGEIVYKTVERYSEGAKKPLGYGGVSVDGEHTIHLYVKGNKLHQYDELTTMHSIWDEDTKQCVMYFDVNATGINMSKFYEINSMMQPTDIKAAKNVVQSVLNPTWGPTGNKPTILGHECEEWGGSLQRVYPMVGIYSLEFAFSLSDIKMPAVYKRHVWGAQVETMALRWTTHHDYGKAPGVGNIDFIIEAEVTEIKPGTVAESVFVIPENYSIIKNTNMMNQIKYVKAVRNAMKERGLR